MLVWTFSFHLPKSSWAVLNLIITVIQIIVKDFKTDFLTLLVLISVL